MSFRTRYNFDSSFVKEHVNTGEVLVDEIHKSFKKLIQEAVLSGTFSQLLNAKAYYELEGNVEKLDELYRVCSELSEDMVIEKDKFFGGDVVDFASLTDTYISLINDAYAHLTSSSIDAAEPAEDNVSNITKDEPVKNNAPTK